MKTIKPQVFLIEQPDMAKRIEYVGRVCYASRDKITEDSYKKFIKNIINRGHTSVLEHSNIVIRTTSISKMHINALLECYTEATGRPHFIRHLHFDDYFSGNIRAWRNICDVSDSCVLYNTFGDENFEYAWMFEDLLRKPKNENRSYKAEIVEPPKNSEIHNILTFEFIISRAVANEIVRHRQLSFAQSSTRYINSYDLEVVKPWWFDDYTMPNYDVLKSNFLTSAIEDERHYRVYIENGKQPQLARDCLPQCTACNLCVTGTIKAWRDFIELRTAPGAHPDIRIVAEQVKNVVNTFYKGENNDE